MENLEKSLQDLEIVELLVNGKVKLEDVDLETKLRISELCEKYLSKLKGENSKLKNQKENLEYFIKKYSKK